MLIFGTLALPQPRSFVLPGGNFDALVVHLHVLEFLFVTCKDK
jgi:hypothetical protein